jgi:hypothetical protein
MLHFAYVTVNYAIISKAYQITKDSSTLFYYQYERVGEKWLLKEKARWDKDS